MSEGESGGVLRRTLRRITAHETELDDAELRDDVDVLGGTPVADCQDRSHVCIAGQVRAVTLKPVGGVPALEAEVSDGADTVTLVFLGRRSIAGIEPGRRLVARGRLGRQDGKAVIMNPRYDLQPTSG